MEEAETTTRFTPKQNEAIALLARGNTWKQTAEEVGVHIDTIANWNRKPEFKQAVDMYSQKAIARREKTVESMMSSLELEALKTLQELMQNAQKESDRIKAAQTILSHQNSRKTESNNQMLVNFAGLQFLGSPKPDDIVAGDIANADS